jgi:hypothetical protein
VLQAVRDFARRRPGVFLAGAVAAGLAAGRLTRGMTDAAHSGGQHQGTPRPPREIPAGAAIPPPPDPDWTTPMPGYPADAVPGAGPGEEIPPGSFQGGGRYQGSGYEESGFPESTPETYRPGQQP